ncbi:anti sigma factor C-terminal domain-containing protein [Planomicrobium sp. CPCC 101079]|uniref:anti sigma factor C-terminal domain-containing protein n=1 Tax=Planomicrobium sp. CPCC 101079 TaxID=2599618 RepID=UPI0011B7FDD7|nr:anti sigma factor C-terminal domain-containing protein [Planomicrobium sp. CPCC 101079]TWT09235.1 hypothetical protein FQV28_06270 [Planomicrobium sp. CPCC 101079]
MSEKEGLFQRDNDFSQLVKKAKRKSIIRNLILSIIVSILFFGGLLWLGTYQMYKKAEETQTYDNMWLFVKGANVESNGSLFTNTPFSTTVTTARYKKIDGVPVPWGEHIKVFSILGTSREIQASTISSSGNIEKERIPLYFEGERVTEFYYPTGKYPYLPDERVLLDEIADHQVVEMAFSFDRDYTINEVRERFSGQLAWYWVDTASASEKENAVQPITGEDAYGFISRIEEMNEDAAERFIHQVEWLQKDGDSKEEAHRLYDILTDAGKKELAPENLKITGAVVTGTPEELKRFNEDPMIRAAVLGATANKY